jgi:hypothetical protein
VIRVQTTYATAAAEPGNERGPPESHVIVPVVQAPLSRPFHERHATAISRARSTAGIALLCLSALVAGSAGAATSKPKAPAVTFAALKQQFAYNHAVPLDVQLGARRVDGDVAITPMSYAIDGWHRATGEILEPAVPSATPRAGIVMAPYRDAKLDWFTSEGEALVSRGAVCISLDDLANGYPKFTAFDYPHTILRLVALRRAIDVLLARTDVDPSRLGFVGLSDGAELGGILAGVDHRVKAFALESAAGVWDIGGNAAYQKRMHLLDPVRYIGHAAPAHLLFQNGRQDDVLAPRDERAFQRAGSRPKDIRWYDLGHKLGDQADQERMAWLTAALGLQPG